ncbi:hypothetical protein JZO83_06620 [Enterococcus sp. DIV1298c]|uniref:hypothetical protein n=1 Tax=Enterococcus sp. DIV1298c TaxID=2815328 RepID=UPI001A91D195|nr:hypothetical protein [Enterococcus sp. DIV1298c]MBO0461418.1 hypothetical protein [Enterococcus sp. DIV1298c]
MKKLSRLLIFISIVCLTSSTMSQHYALTNRIENNGPITVNSSDSVIAETTENTSTESTTQSLEEPEKMARAEQQSLSDKINQTSVLESVLNEESEQSITAYVGTGTESDPFLIGSAADLTAAIERIRYPTPNMGPYYFSLTNDIYYSYRDKFYVDKHLVINGNGYHMLADNLGSTVQTNLFEVRPNIPVELTLRNLNVGSDSLTDENGLNYERYFSGGFVQTRAGSIKLTIENVNFFSKQNFSFINATNDQSGLYFSGTNSIRNVEAGTRKLFQTKHLQFFENSKTIIEENSTASGLLYVSNPFDGLGSSIIVRSNAEVILNTSTANLGDERATYINVHEQGKLVVHANHPDILKNVVTGVYENGTISVFNAVGMVLNATIFNIRGETGPGNIHLKADNGITVSGIFSFSRTDLGFYDAGGYKLTSFYGDNRQYHQNLRGGNVDYRFTTASLKASGDTGTIYELIYHKIPSINNVDIDTEVDLDISNLTFNVEDATLSETLIKNTDFKIGTQRLSNTIYPLNTYTTQSNIQTATVGNSGIIASGSTVASPNWTQERLRAGTYYVYIKITGQMQENPELKHLLSESLWYEVAVQVPRSPLNIEVPLEKVFKVREEGEFDTIELSQPIISHSNFPINLTVTDVVEHTTDSPVTLVNEILPDADKHLRLHLASTDNQDSGPLVVGENQASPIEIPPFFDNPVHLYLKGHYVGGLHVKHDVSYSFIYQLTAK